jgi:large subunit ribosomal protein L31
VPPWSETKACLKETNKMKKDIHPNYVECTVKCSCGNTFTTHSTKSELRIDICNECHPFYTGTQKLIDTGGRVQRFADRFGNATDVVAQREAARKAARAAEVAQREADKKAAREAKAAEKSARAAKFAEEAAAKQAAEAAVEAEVAAEPAAEEAAAE